MFNIHINFLYRHEALISRGGKWNLSLWNEGETGRKLMLVLSPSLRINSLYNISCKQVTACYKCNSKKGQKTLEEAKMKLIKVPKVLLTSLATIELALELPKHLTVQTYHLFQDICVATFPFSTLYILMKKIFTVVGCRPQRTMTSLQYH